MPPLDPAILARHRRQNRRQSLAILVGLAAWMALIGWLLAGLEGIAWAVVGAVVMLSIQPSRSTTVLRALYGGRIVAAGAPRLRALVEGLARRAGLERVPELIYLPTPRLMALSTGNRADSAIAVSDGMVRTLTGRELAAVIAHEISHLRHGDLETLRLADAAGTLTRTLSLVGLVSAAFYLPVAAGVNVAFVPLLLLVFAPLVSDLLSLKLSRTREFAADAGAAELTGDPEALMQALHRIEAVQGAVWERLVRLPPWLRLIRSHPTTAERVQRLAELVPDPRFGWVDWDDPGMFREINRPPGGWRIHRPGHAWW